MPLTNVVIELQEGDRLRRVLPYGFAARKLRDHPPAGSLTEDPPRTTEGI